MRSSTMREGLHLERDVRTEREGVRTEREGVRAERESVRTERDGVRTEREGFSRALCGLLVVVVCGLAIGTPVASGQSSGDKYIGTWAGTWDGAGSGDFELTLDKAKDGPLAGRVAVGTDGGNYNANLKTINFDGPKMTASYDFPLDPSAEIFVAATFEDKSAKGTWAMRPKGQEGDIAAGTFTVARK